jgi:hypothetical protein
MVGISVGLDVNIASVGDTVPKEGVGHIIETTVVG